MSGASRRIASAIILPASIAAAFLDGPRTLHASLHAVDVPQSAADDGAPLAVAFRPERRDYVFGEPIYVVAEVRNSGTAPVSLPNFADPGPSGRHDGYEFTAVDEQDGPVRDPLVSSLAPGPIGSSRTLSPGGVIRERLLLNQWCRFERPGTYRVAGRRVTPAGTGDAAQPSTARLAITGERFEIVLRADDAALEATYGRILAELDFTTLSWLWHPSLGARFVEWLRGPLFVNEALALLRALERIDRGAYVRGIVALIARGQRDERVLELAAREIVQRDMMEVVPWLRGALASPSPRARTIAVDALSQLGSTGRLTTRDLVALFRTDDVLLRTRVAGALPYSKGDRRNATRLLRDAIERDPAPGVRLTAAASLAILGDVKGIESLIAGLTGDDAADRTRYYFLDRSVGARVPHTAKAWNDWFTHTRGYGDAAARRQLYVQILESREPPKGYERQDAARLMWRLGRHGRPAVSVLRRALSDPDEWVRLGAAESLTRLDEQPEPTISAMVALFGRRDDVSRTAGALAAWLKRAGEPRLRSALQSPDPLVRLRAAEALGLADAREEESVAALGRALADENADVSRYATVALGQLGRRAARHAPAIARLLDDPFTPTRVLALETLGRIGDPRVTGHVRPLLNDAEPLVREYASRTLESLGVSRSD